MITLVVGLSLILLIFNILLDHLDNSTRGIITLFVAGIIMLLSFMFNMVAIKQYRIVKKELELLKEKEYQQTIVTECDEFELVEGDIYIRITN